MNELEYEKPAIEILNDVTIYCLKNGANEIYLEPTENNLIIRYNINGTIYDYITLPESYKSQIISRVKILSGMQPTKKQDIQYGHIKSKLDDNFFELNVVNSYTEYGEKITIVIEK